MLRELRNSMAMLLALTLLTGAVYPLLVTTIAQLAFPHQAQGSLIRTPRGAVGSELIGQNFTRPDYFWGRLSATGPVPCNAAASSGSNYGPLNPELLKAAEARLAALRRYDPKAGAAPVDLVTASGSGLDPHISPAAAEYQAPRVAAARQLSLEKVQVLIRQQTLPRQWGVLGEPRVNVLQLNLALDALTSPAPAGETK
jgi:K+-transporting ATPase ATPase C chain